MEYSSFILRQFFQLSVPVFSQVTNILYFLLSHQEINPSEKTIIETIWRISNTADMSGISRHHWMGRCKYTYLLYSNVAIAPITVLRKARLTFHSDTFKSHFFEELAFQEILEASSGEFKQMQKIE